MSAITTNEVKRHSGQYLKRLRPGLEMSIQLFHPRPLRFQSLLLGFRLDDYLVISLPDSLSQKYHNSIFYTGNKIIVRFIVEGTTGQCVAFSTTVESCITFPRQMLFLKFPKRIDTIELRQFPRIATCFKAKIRSLPTRDPYFVVGKVRNVSLGGCCFTFEDKDHAITTKHKKVEIIMGTQNISSFIGEVRNQRDKYDNVHIGVKFIQNAQDNEKQLEMMHIDSDSLRSD